MTVENLINIVRLGRQLTPAQLERIPAMERTLAAKDSDFTQLSIAYSAAIEAGKAKGVQFSAEECGYVCDALEECERLKEAVRATWRAKAQGVSAYTAALKAVEELL